MSLTKIASIIFIVFTFIFSPITLANFNEPIAINSATKKELLLLKGIGPKRADAIMEKRSQAKITSEEDIAAIEGFNAQLAAQIAKQVYFD